MWHVRKRALESLETRLRVGKEVSRQMLGRLSPEQQADYEILVPIDMRGVAEELDDVDSMMDHLGLQGMAQAVVRARQAFKGRVPAEESPQQMAVAEWYQEFFDYEGSEVFDEGEFVDEWYQEFFDYEGSEVFDEGEFVDGEAGVMDKLGFG